MGYGILGFCPHPGHFCWGVVGCVCVCGVEGVRGGWASFERKTPVNFFLALRAKILVHRASSKSNFLLEETNLTVRRSVTNFVSGFPDLVHTGKSDVNYFPMFLATRTETL